METRGHTETRTGAVVLAAGQSRRMGTQKLLLPWGSRTVIAQVVGVLASVAPEQIVVVTGGSHEQVAAALHGLNVTLAHNSQYRQGEMLGSLRVGLAALGETINAALVVLADQPQIQPEIVELILRQAEHTSSPLIVPSYRQRRGHPWLVRRALWPELLGMDADTETLRDFLNRHAHQIEYLNVESSSVLMDLDTPEDYRQQRPGPPGEN
jgi:molybdenum cofactor cytidylyltransferase